VSIRCLMNPSARPRAGITALALLTLPLLAGPALAQVTASAASVKPPQAFDPGPRPVGNQSITVTSAAFANGIVDPRQPQDAAGNGAGRQLAVLTPGQTAFWFSSLLVFGQPVTVGGGTDPVSNDPSIPGLGPAFNGDSCFMCHSYPAIGGTSPPINPQAVAATARGAQNSVPSFVTRNGPVREAHFIESPGDGLPDGAVRELFSIQGRADAPPGCTLAQPNFSRELKRGNVALRIPTQTFGVGFIENTSDAALRASFQATAFQRSVLGIGGHFNTSGNDQTIARFGWKAQDKSLLEFAGEAANVELGITNELFPNERIPGRNCDVHALPEDVTNVVPVATLATLPNDGDAASLAASAITNFGVFMRLNAAPSQCAFDSGVDATGAALCTPLASSKKAASIADGQAKFTAVGCALCHTESLQTGPSPFGSLNNAVYHPFSDFALHKMGVNLADGVVQGAAAGDEFRSAPLWGIGQRLFFLHDGRTSDLLEAIDAHKSQGSEANTVIRNFDNLPDAQKQDVLNYLRSL